MAHLHDVQPLVERLSGLGLTREEATVYVRLTTHGATKAGDLAAMLGYPRPKTYRLLNSLMHRGFVSATLSRPTVFAAAAPDRLFSGLLASIQTRAHVLEAARGELGPQLAKLHGARGQERGRITYKILQGRAETVGIAEAMLRDARERIVLLDGTTGAASVRALALERGVAGLPLRALLPGPFPRVKLESWTRTPLRLREIPRTTARFLLADEQALLWLAHDPGNEPEGPRDAALWTDAPDLLETLAGLFDAAWERGKPPSPDVTDHDLEALGFEVQEPGR